MTSRVFSKTDVLDILHSSVAEITFTKTNGEDRIMVCTLKEDVVPTYDRRTATTKKINDSVIAAFDLNKNEWRSFRLDSVKAIVYPKTWR